MGGYASVKLILVKIQAAFCAKKIVTREGVIDSCE